MIEKKFDDLMDEFRDIPITRENILEADDALELMEDEIRKERAELQKQALGMLREDSKKWLEQSRRPAPDKLARHDFITGKRLEP